MSTQYTFAHPASSSPAQLSKAKVNFLEHFYKLSDDPNASRQYADVFVDEGELVMMGKKVVGWEGRFVFCFVIFIECACGD